MEKTKASFLFSKQQQQQLCYKFLASQSSCISAAAAVLCAFRGGSFGRDFLLWVAEVSSAH
jgi:hypothetical protein